MLYAVGHTGSRLPMSCYCTLKLIYDALFNHSYANLLTLDFRIAKEAEASLYAEKKAAEAVVTKAEASFIAKRKEAEALTEMAKAYGHLSAVLGGPQSLLQYMMLQDNTYEKLANANATAINGLQPKITVWNTGAGEGVNDGTAAVRNIMQSLPPLLSTINEQTGIKPPGWLAQMGEGKQGIGGKLSNGEVNGH